MEVLFIVLKKYFVYEKSVTKRGFSLRRLPFRGQVLQLNSAGRRRQNWIFRTCFPAGARPLRYNQLISVWKKAYCY